MQQKTQRTIKSPNKQMDFDFLSGMAARMEVSFYKYGDYGVNYRGGEYSKEFLSGLNKSLRKLVRKWKGQGTTANGNAVMFALERLLLYTAGGKTKSGTVRPGNTEYLMDAANGLMIEFRFPQVPNASFKATDDGKSPGFSGLSSKEREELGTDKEMEDFRREHSEEFRD
jgi:hypothetical protein